LRSDAPSGSTGILDKRAGHRSPALADVTAPASGFRQRWTDFWFTPLNPTGLHVLRVGCGLLFLLWLLPLSGHLDELFGLRGWFDVQAYREAGRMPGGPPVYLGWSILYLCGTDSTSLHVVYWLSILVLSAFTLGLATRITSVLTWVIVVSFTASPLASYDADFILIVLAFYLMIGYLLYGSWSRSLSPVEKFLGPQDAFLFHPWLARRSEPLTAPEQRSYAANLALRLVQVHFALIVVTAGFHKLQNGDWWAGVAYFFPLHPPATTTFDAIKTDRLWANVYLFFWSLIEYATLAWQLAFPFFAWRTGKLRFILLGGGVLGWIGSVLVLHLPLFGPIYLVGCLSYLTPEEWQRAAEWFSPLARRLTRTGKPVTTAAARETHVKA
jgi:hypothetical protein